MNPLNWETSKISKKYFTLLKEANILHESPESAAQFLNKIYPILNRWWYSKNTECKKSFCNKFIYIPRNNQYEILKLK